MRKLLGRPVLFVLVALLTLPLFCPTVRADDSESDNCTSSDNVTVTIQILSRGSGGGGGGIGGAWPYACPYHLKVTMFGTVSWISATYYGETCQKFEATKKAVTLKIAKNTSCRDKDGKRLEELEIADCTGTIPSSNEFLIIDSFCLTSKGGEARFNPPLHLTFSYNLAGLPAGVAETDLFVGYYADGKWNRLTSMVNALTNTVAVDVSHLTIFAVLAKMPVEEESPPEEEPGVTPSPPTTEPPLPSDEGLNWWLIGGMIAAIIIAGSVVAYFEIKRNKRKKAKT